MILRMALRNLDRHRIRSLLSFLAIALGVLVVLLTKSLVDGTISSITRNTIELTSGHVRITHSEYRAKERLMSLNYPIDGFNGNGVEDMVNIWRQEPLVRLVSPRIKFAAMASKGGELIGMMGLGVEPQTEMKLAKLSRYLHAGRFIKPGTAEVVMGERLLRKLGLSVGDRVTLVFNDAFGSIQGYSFDIVGELRSGLKLMDAHLAYVPLDTAQRMLNMQGMATEVLLLAKNEGQTSALHSRVEEILAERDTDTRYEAVPWYRYNEMISYIGAAKVTYNFVYAFILLLASFAVINTMIMVVNERTREIGMLSALGLRPGQILQLFLLEGLLLGLAGSAIGTLTGAAVTKLLSVTGIQYSGIEAIGEEFLMTPRIYPEFNPELLLYAFTAGLIVSAVAVYFPARRAARLEPTQALRS